MKKLSSNSLLDVEGLKVHFYTKRGVGKAVDGVSFTVGKGETLGLIGESGCGKTVTALSIVGLHPKPAARITDGSVMLRGDDLLQLPTDELRKYRGKHIAMILQDPMTALNPVYTLQNQIGESLRLHQNLRGLKLRQRIVELLKLLHISAPSERLGNYPHQLSGGMRQRVVGAIALSCDPVLLIADEPTTSLDVTIEAAFLSHLKEIQQERELSILFITHDFGVVSKMCDRVAVMYAGQLVEVAPTLELFRHPKHPYTEALLGAVPDLSREKGKLMSIEGSPPSIYELPVGCNFAPRCPSAMSQCENEVPPEVELSPSHSAKCWLHV
jgi:peptide/nickel transport system ATP-binding protein/oligopeptide transport system ATP-binding protein